MPGKLRLVETGRATEMQRVGRKSNAEYGRDGHKYLTPDKVAAFVKLNLPGSKWA